jgi:hypothetical protein
VNVTPRMQLIDGETLVASFTHAGHVFVAAVILPPFVKHDPAAMTRCINLAQQKAVAALALNVARVLGQIARPVPA